jgi:hypothetical protein
MSDVLITLISNIVAAIFIIVTFTLACYAICVKPDYLDDDIVSQRDIERDIIKYGAEE